jgi:hypothetical protein
MKIAKTVDGLLAAPVSAPTVLGGPRMRELVDDVMRNAPELAEYLDLGSSAAAAADSATTQDPLRGLQSKWAYNVELGSANDLSNAWQLHKLVSP